MSNFREAIRESYEAVKMGPVVNGERQLGQTGVGGGHARVASGRNVVPAEKRPERVVRRCETGSLVRRFIWPRKKSPGAVFRAEFPLCPAGIF
jgi:hypothetical protein